MLIEPGKSYNQAGQTCLYVTTKLGDLLDDLVVVGGLVPSLIIPETQKTLEILDCDFSEPEDVGPRRVARFLYTGPDADLQADVVGFVRALLSKPQRCKSRRRNRDATWD